MSLAYGSVALKSIRDSFISISYIHSNKNHGKFYHLRKSRKVIKVFFSISICNHSNLNSLMEIFGSPKQEEEGWAFNNNYFSITTFFSVFNTAQESTEHCTSNLYTTLMYKYVLLCSILTKYYLHTRKIRIYCT